MDKLIMYNCNKYIFTKATMKYVDKIANIKNYPEENLNWKVVPNILKLTLEEELKFEYQLPHELAALEASNPDETSEE